MQRQEKTHERKKPYSVPQLVDFGTIETMTGECVGICLDGNNGAGRGG